MILASEGDREQLREVLSRLLERGEEYVGRMERAVDIYRSNPAGPREQILYYTEMLLRYGDLGFLVNKVLKEQSLVEVYNLDILGVGVVGVVLAVYVVVRCTWAVCCKRKHLKRE